MIHYSSEVGGGYNLSHFPPHLGKLEALHF